MFGENQKEAKHYHNVCYCLRMPGGGCGCGGNSDPAEESAGLMNLALEVMALEEETGEGFWTDAANRIGSGNAQAKYSVNIGGIPGTQNITVGFDGAVKRDMEQGFFEADFAASVANAGRF